MYVSTYREIFPVGRGFEWTKIDNHFTRKMICSKSGNIHLCYLKYDNIIKVSFQSIRWMEFMSNDPKFVDKNGVRQPIQHGWNSTEKLVGPYPVDGFAQVDGRDIFLQFDGCHFHKCPYCGTDGNDVEVRNRFLRTRGELITIFECQFKKITKKELPTPKISPFMWSDRIREKEIIEK